VSGIPGYGRQEVTDRVIAELRQSGREVELGQPEGRARAVDLLEQVETAKIRVRFEGQ